MTTTHLMGESYGGFLSFVIAAKDSASERPSIDGEIFIFSPPLDLQASMSHIDLDFQSPKEPGCMSWWKLLVDFLPELKHLTPGDAFSADLRRCMKTLLAEGSHAMFVKSVEKWHEISRQEQVPSSWFHPFQYADWKSSLTFSKYQDEYNKDFAGMLSEQEVRGRVAYWLNQMPVEKQKMIRILSTQDDFLNLDPASSKTSSVEDESGAKWQPVREALVDPDRQLVILPWGGHVSYFELPEFEAFLQSVFPSISD